MVILPHPRYGNFYRFRLLFNSSRTRPSLKNNERSLHKTLSGCYWSRMSMFDWVCKKSENLTPKWLFCPTRGMAIFTEFACFFIPPSKGRLSRMKRDLFPKLGQCATEAPCQCFLEFVRNLKFDPKWWFCPTRGMAIFTDFACFLTPPWKGRISRTKRDLLTKLGQCATEEPCQCFLEFQTNPKFDPKWWFCPTRGMAIFTNFDYFLTPPSKGCISRTKGDLFTKLGQCATEAPCQCLLEFQTNPKFDPKWWFCPTRGMAIFTAF